MEDFKLYVKIYLFCIPALLAAIIFMELFGNSDIVPIVVFIVCLLLELLFVYVIIPCIADSIADKENKNALKEKRERILNNSFTYTSKVHPSVAESTSFAEKEMNESVVLYFAEKTKILEAEEFNAWRENRIKEFDELKAINLELGYSEDEGVEEVPPKRYITNEKISDELLPKNFLAMYNHFRKLEEWQDFINYSINSVLSNLSPQSYYGDFFKKIAAYTIKNNSATVAFFPHCVAYWSKGTGISVVPYKKIKVEVNEEVFSTTSYCSEYELISFSYAYQNKDGTPDKRYKNNPRYAEYRKWELTVKVGNHTITKEEKYAKRFKEKFDKYVEFLINSEYSFLLKNYFSKKSDFDFESSLTKCEEKKKKKAEEQRLEAERIEKEKRELEKQKRIEAERIKQIELEKERKKIAEAEAVKKKEEEEKRKIELQKRRDLIQKQKEKNAEDQLQKTIQKNVSELFGIEVDAVEEKWEKNLHSSTNKATEEKEQKSAFSLISSPSITNNVFKVVLKQLIQFEGGKCCIYFEDENQKRLSNERFFDVAEEGKEITVGIILLSGIDFTTIKNCRMKIEKNGELVEEFQFKMNISFYSEF